MIPEGYEPLSLADNVLVTRINLCCAAFGLFVFALLADGIGAGGRALALLASALLVFLARQAGIVLRRLDPGARGRDKGEDLVFGHPLIPF